MDVPETKCCCNMLLDTVSFLRALLSFFFCEADCKGPVSVQICSSLRERGMCGYLWVSSMTATVRRWLGHHDLSLDNSV